MCTTHDVDASADGANVVYFMVQAFSKDVMTSNMLQVPSPSVHWTHVSFACGMNRELTVLPSQKEQLPHVVPASVLKRPLKSTWLRQPSPTAFLMSSMDRLPNVVDAIEALKRTNVAAN